MNTQKAVVGSVVRISGILGYWKVISINHNGRINMYECIMLVNPTGIPIKTKKPKPKRVSEDYIKLITPDTLYTEVEEFRKSMSQLSDILFNNTDFLV